MAGAEAMRPGLEPRSSPSQRRALGRLRAQVVDLSYLLPALVLIVGLMLVPGIYALSMAFFQWTPGYDSPFVGLDNFSRLLSSVRFHQILVNQAVLLIGVPFWTILPLVIAFILHERVPLPGVFRTIFFFPAILSAAVVGILFRSILAPEGMLNELLRAVGLGGAAQNWIDDAAFVKPTLIVLLAWASLGLGVVIFSSALSTIRPELLEVAVIDGASWWQRLRHVVLPSIRSTIVLWTTYQIVGLFLFTFGWIYVLTLGGPGVSSTTIDFDVYRNALKYGFFGLASAESVVLLGMVFLVIAVSWLLMRRIGQGEEA
jgi:multiple sugar transport system permease protein